MINYIALSSALLVASVVYIASSDDETDIQKQADRSCEKEACERVEPVQSSFNCEGFDYSSLKENERWQSHIVHDGVSYEVRVTRLVQYSAGEPVGRIVK